MSMQPSPERRVSPVAMLLAGVAGLAVAALAGGLALAKSSTTLRAVNNAALGKRIVVDSHGLTVYQLRPETKSHLLCKKSNDCFSAWPPFTVPSRDTKLTAGPGVTGKLGILHRNGRFQVMLAGRPLYHFAGDSSKGDANGQGLKSFGGTWHVVSASSSSTTTTTTTGTTTTTTPTYPYPYP
jgi:predicted lipoprotein with Yx(FWY)xxD motif